MSFLTTPYFSIPLWFWLMVLSYLVLIPLLWFTYRRWLKRLDLRLGVYLSDFLAWRYGSGLSEDEAKKRAQKSSGIRFRTIRFRELPSRDQASYFPPVVASIGFGLAKRRGRYLRDLGAMVVPNSGRRRSAGASALVPQVRPLVQDQLWPAGNRVLEPLAYDKLRFEQQQADLANAFSNFFDPETVSVAVQYRNRLLWESYAGGLDASISQPMKALSPFVFATLFGFLSHQRRLAIEQAVPEGGWTQDSRHQIRFADLLKSTSGLAPLADKTLNRMLFHVDPSREGEKKPQSLRELVLSLKQVRGNGEKYDTSATSVFALSHLLSLGFGERLDMYQSFIRRTIFDRLHMIDTSIAVTWDGMVNGWSGLQSTPRDMLRFASLYQSGGFWQGERVLEESWLDFATSPSEASGSIGAGTHAFVNVGANLTQRTSKKSKPFRHGPPYSALPSDALFALRDGMSLLVIIPSEKLSICMTSANKPIDDAAIEGFLRRLITYTQTQKIVDLHADPAAAPEMQPSIETSVLMGPQDPQVMEVAESETYPELEPEVSNEELVELTEEEANKSV